ncbi:putative transcription factor C2H2 family [Rosa chinensis]|uniref:RING-type E3 ubiquitin transferase n=1 Tax=Rosa chinensis TaxID=74649 RepID=A0A2P6RF68_ROSCH|nr:putative transcription factor C2H2 family [Rosa chinensis]
MGVPHDLHQGILQKLFEAVVAAVSANTIVVGVWECTTHLIGVGVDADGDVYGGDGEGDVYGGRADVFQYESSSRPKFIPASNSSIEGLEQMTLDITTITQTPSCVICLEDFAAFVDYQQKEPITRLPCGHHYHVHCIVQWLEFSHLCPLCRYPMPTEDDRSNCGGSEASIAR